MCGRSSLHDAPVSVLERFHLPPVLPGFAPRYNIAPSQDQWTILLDDNRAPAVKPLRWGLIPSWASDPSMGSRMINARAESLAEKPSWENSLRFRRCLVLADGYYEWSGTGKTRAPWFFHLSGNRPFAMAGLWDRWERPGDRRETCRMGLRERVARVPVAIVGRVAVGQVGAHDVRSFGCLVREKTG